MSELPPRMVDEAMAYACGSWPVFPCHPKTKQPLTQAGFKDASTDADTITRCWKQWPKAMIGVPTGILIGAFVIDIDAGYDEETGEVFEAASVLADLEAELEAELPHTWKCRTPRGGLHLYFQVPPGCDMPGNRTAMMNRVDVRGNGGYVIVAPSVRHDGGSYDWLSAPNETPLANAPTALLDLIFRRGRWASDKSHDSATMKPRGAAEHLSPVRRYGQAALKAEALKVAQAVPGSRNSSLNLAAFNLGRLQASGALIQQEVEAELEKAAQVCGLVKDDGRRAVLSTINSGLEAGMARPRTLPDSLSRSPSASAGSGAMTSEVDQSVGSLDRELGKLDCTDRGNAQRFVARAEGRLVWCDKAGWKFWNGRRWLEDGADDEVLRIVHETVDAIKREAAVIPPHHDSEAEEKNDR